MTWQEAIARIRALPRTRVGPKTVARDLDAPDGSKAWLGVETSPVVLHREAALPRDVYAIARCLSSETGTANAYAALAAAECIVNQAARLDRSPYEYLVYTTAPWAKWTQGKYGEQRGRRASTRQDPDLRGVEAAKIVTSSKIDFCRGHTWYEPDLQDGGRQGSHKLNKDAVDIAQSWSNDGYEWVGHLPGVDAYRELCVLRKVTKVDPANTRAWIEMIERGRRGTPQKGEASPVAEVREVARQGLPWWTIAAGGTLLLA